MSIGLPNFLNFCRAGNREADAIGMNLWMSDNHARVVVNGTSLGKAWAKRHQIRIVEALTTHPTTTSRQYYSAIVGRTEVRTNRAPETISVDLVTARQSQCTIMNQ